MREISLVGAGGVVVDQREVAAHVWHMQPITFGKHDRLDHRKALGRPVAQVVLGLIEGAAMKQLPCCVAEVEEGRAVVVNQKSPVGAHLQHMFSPLPVCQRIVLLYPYLSALSADSGASMPCWCAGKVAQI